MFKVQRLLSWPAWLGIGAIAAVLAVLISVLALADGTTPHGEGGTAPFPSTVIPPTSTSSTTSALAASTTSTRFAPAPSASTTTSPPTTAAPRSQYLGSQLGWVDADYGPSWTEWHTGPVKANTVTYTDALYRGVDPCCDQWVEFDLNRSYGHLVATMAVADDSRRDSHVIYRVIGDGLRLHEGQVHFGEAVNIDVPVKGVLRLRLESRALTGDIDNTTIVWGAIRASTD